MPSAFTKKAVVLLSHGTPAALSLGAVRKFLRGFLDDERVIGLPALLRKLLLFGVILPFRARKSLAMYEKIWLPAGSPLAIYTESLRQKLEARLGGGIPVFTAMHAGEPSVAAVLREVVARGIAEIVVIPQFPQDSEAGRSAAVERFLALSRKILPAGMVVKIVPAFFAARGYVGVVAKNLPPALSRGVARKFVFSFHGVPVKSIFRGVEKAAAGFVVATKPRPRCDPGSHDFSAALCAGCVGREKCYRRQCYLSAAAIADFAGIDRNNVVVSFQSRFGHGKWLAPETRDVLRAEPNRDNVVLCSPGFTADCVETLWELRGLGAGTLVACANDADEFADFLAECVVAGGLPPAKN